MVDKLTKEDLEEYREAFAFYDKDRDGKILGSEVALVIRACGQAPSQRDVVELVKSVGETAKLDFNEFITLATRKIVPCGPLDAILEAFKVFDKDGQGRINNSELKHVFVNLGEKLSELEGQMMIEEAGMDAEGYINYEQFVRDMMQFK